ncbi:hypothetical protein JL111_20560 [Paracoccus sp. KCTC 42845]|uniref:Uncharacterized protein n=1 Tax=Paracoccus aerius TaxID=1915382 RepID=A0ABS1SAS1_9RHOB|nr:hypothetical protein [Paracoccus aerius]
MLGQAGWIGLGIMAMYLGAFAWGTAEAARVAGQPVWLFGRARGTERVAAFGFRLAFALALLGPLIWLVFPALRRLNPLWAEEPYQILGIAGVLLAVAGAMLAFAAQIEPPRVHRRVCGSMIRLLFRLRSSLRRRPPLLRSA